MKYHYLVASLPSFEMGDPPPISPEEFFFKSTGVLSRPDREELGRLVRGELAGLVSDFGRRWHEADTQLRNAAVRVRAGRRGVDATPFLREHGGFRVAIEKAVADAFAKTTPLELERAMDQCRWDLVEEMARRDAFGLAAVLAFVVRLRLTGRWAGIKEEAGRARVEEIIAANVNEESLQDFFAMDEDSERALR